MCTTWLHRISYKKVHELAENIEVICREPLCFEQILQKLFQHYRLVMNFEQYVLVGSTVRSYLAWLKDNGLVNVSFKDGMMMWRKK